MSLDELEMENLANIAIEELKTFYNGPIHKEILMEKLFESKPESVVEAKKNIFVFYGKLLKDTHDFHWKYDLNKLPEGSVWEPMRKLVTAVRVNELKQVKVTQSKGKYRVRQLRSTYFGKMIFKELKELGNKWALKETEYNKVKLVCKKLNLTLPEVIQPTTTELFFGEDEDE